MKDGTAEFKIKDMKTHHICGEIVALVTPPPDYEHLLLCDGQTINANDYPELVKALGSNVLPNLNGRFLQGGSTAGQYVEAGLPELYGSTNALAFQGVTTQQGVQIGDGVFKSIRAYGASVVTTSGNNSTLLTFRASDGNSVYGASNTVQPPAYTVRYYICYG